MSSASEESHGLTIGKELLIVHMQTITKELTQEIPLLAMLDEGTRSSLLEGLEAKEFAEDEVVYEQGSRDQQIIWVASGEFELFARFDSLNFACSLGVCKAGHL